MTRERRERRIIRRMLNLPTAHLPQRLGTPDGLDRVAGIVAHTTDVGVLLWAPDDPDESAQAMADPVPNVILAIQRYARTRGCAYVLVDADADRVDDLPFWEW